MTCTRIFKSSHHSFNRHINIVQGKATFSTSKFAGQLFVFVAPAGTKCRHALGQSAHKSMKPRRNNKLCARNYRLAHSARNIVDDLALFPRCRIKFLQQKLIAGALMIQQHHVFFMIKKPHQQFHGELAVALRCQIFRAVNHPHIWDDNDIRPTRVRQFTTFRMVKAGEIRGDREPFNSIYRFCQIIVRGLFPRKNQVGRFRRQPHAQCRHIVLKRSKCLGQKDHLPAGLCERRVILRLLSCHIFGKHAKLIRESEPRCEQHQVYHRRID